MIRLTCIAFCRRPAISCVQRKMTTKFREQARRF